MESLLETPFLSAATGGEEITIADYEEEEGGEEVKSRQIAQEQSNNVVGDKKDIEEDDDDKDNKEDDAKAKEKKDVAKQHLKCTSVTFHGCDDKCLVEDLTPYQV